MIVVTGVESPQIYGRGDDAPAPEPTSGGGDDIDYVE
jgi:cell division protein FtsZ